MSKGMCLKIRMHFYLQAGHARPRIPQIRVSNTRLAQAASGCAPSVDVLPIFDVKQQSVRNPARMDANSLVGLVTTTSVWGKTQYFGYSIYFFILCASYATVHVGSKYRAVARSLHTRRIFRMEFANFLRILDNPDKDKSVNLSQLTLVISGFSQNWQSSVCSHMMTLPKLYYENRKDLSMLPIVTAD
ncbi:hypothetical protein WN51_06306 [Melipona quadrifasciata]|uniref:Uncharacterized protein n=1 Tax=Melipona quadrifasciata TaxID=166423 RepID=A0A0M8ZT80_9HYME|nr:hypothetical protein WN51_06306 [Melipona quadrifasciata]